MRARGASPTGRDVRRLRRNEEELARVDGEYVVRNRIDTQVDFGRFVRRVADDLENEFDIVALVTAKREGLGKSILSEYLNFQLWTMLHSGEGPWPWQENTVFYRWNPDFRRRYQAPVTYLPINVDEAILALLSRLSSSVARAMIIEDLVTGRFMSKYVELSGPNYLWFDVIVRAHKSHAWLHLAKRGCRACAYKHAADACARKGCEGAEHVDYVQVYVMWRSDEVWPSRDAVWDCIAYLEYTQPMDDDFLRRYRAVKLLEWQDWIRERTAKATRGRPRRRGGKAGPEDA